MQNASEHPFLNRLAQHFLDAIVASASGRPDAIQFQSSKATALKDSPRSRMFQAFFVGSQPISIVKCNNKKAISQAFDPYTRRNSLFPH
ncbi:hypothetical protein [Rhodopila sp.]|uniref:hypothetical protein n=1 Tax=Rhodopila sp. TaxID=2480087 RepID=UPI003D0A5144